MGACIAGVGKREAIVRLGDFSVYYALVGFFLSFALVGL